MQNLVDSASVSMLAGTLTIVVLLFIFSFLAQWFLARRTLRTMNNSFSKIREEIRFSIQPMADIPHGVEDLAELAGEVWKIQQRLTKVSDQLPEAHRRGLESSVQRFHRYLEKFDIVVQDYTGQKYNEGLNLDVLSVEHDPSLTEPIIKETREPTIICRGRVVKKAKIILATNKI